jgi:hypothetical protein
VTGLSFGFICSGFKCLSGPHDLTRTASARRTCRGANRSNEMLHNKSQEINYQSDGRETVGGLGADEATVDDTELTSQQTLDAVLIIFSARA